MNVAGQKARMQVLRDGLEEWQAGEYDAQVDVYRGGERQREIVPRSISGTFSPFQKYKADSDGRDDSMRGSVSSADANGGNTYKNGAANVAMAEAYASS